MTYMRFNDCRYVYAHDEHSCALALPLKFMVRMTALATVRGLVQACRGIDATATPLRTVPPNASFRAQRPHVRAFFTRLLPMLAEWATVVKVVAHQQSATTAIDHRRAITKGVNSSPTRVLANLPSESKKPPASIISGDAGLTYEGVAL